VYHENMKRPYKLKQRARSRDQTRQKIIDAAIHLHQAKGMAETSMSDIAARAKVGKVTVYRHFPDGEALVTACSGQYFERHPAPDLENWLAIRDASERLRRGLKDTYAYHRSTEPMISQVLGEARDHPVMEPYHSHWRRAQDVLAAPWPASARRKKQLTASLALALSFETWRVLVREQGLTDDQAINLMMRFIEDC
jgi:AcrR family transcriptional regulator